MPLLNTTPKLRDLMPEGYLSKLMELTGSNSYSYLAQMVRNEYSASKFWPYALDLAREHDPAGYAAWAAANPEKLPKEVAVAA